MKPTRKELLAFVENIVKNYEYQDENDTMELSSEDAMAERNEIIRDAMELLGELSKCDECGAEEPYIIGCPDGAEVCQGCFDGGAH